MPTKAFTKPAFKTTRKYIRVRLDIQHPEGVSPESIMDEMDYSFTSKTKGAKIMDTHIEEYEEGSFTV